MKSKIKVRQNPSASRSAPQAKTPQEKLVTLCFYSMEDDKELSQVEIPETVFNALQQRAKSTDTPLEQVITDAVEKFCPPLEHQNPAVDRQSPPKFLIPAHVAREADDALSIMQCVGNAASALAMINAEQIATGCQHCGGWEQLEAPGFSEGSLELARIVCHDFASSFSDVSNGLRSMIGKIRDMNQPVTVPAQPDIHILARVHYKNESWDLENACGSLRHCLDIQGMVLSKSPRSNEIAHYTSFALSKKLESAFDELWQAQLVVHKLFASIALPAGQTTELRRAA